MLKEGLNPCFSGLYSLTLRMQHPPAMGEVGLNPCFSGLYYLTIDMNLIDNDDISLNPCFSGLYYLTTADAYTEKLSKKVLILVLVDFTT